MRRPKQIVSIIAVAAAAAAVAGCGSNDPEPSIPRDDAEGLVSRLAEIEDNIDVGSCTVAGQRTDELIAEINELPSDVDQDVQNALAQGSNNLKELIDEQCEEPVEETTTEETEPTETQETETQPTETEPTETQPTTPTTPTTPTQPPGEGGGGSGGVGPGGFQP